MHISKDKENVLSARLPLPETSMSLGYCQESFSCGIQLLLPCGRKYSTQAVILNAPVILVVEYFKE